MIIGNFTYDAKTDTYTGDVTTLSFHATVELRPIEKSADREPDYRVVSKAGSGNAEFGAAWKRTSERGHDFVSVSLDDPAFAGSLNAALFMAEDGKTAQLVWNRPKAKETVKDEPAPKAKAPAKKAA